MFVFPFLVFSTYSINMLDPFLPLIIKLVTFVLKPHHLPHYVFFFVKKRKKRKKKKRCGG